MKSVLKTASNGINRTGFDKRINRYHSFVSIIKEGLRERKLEKNEVMTIQYGIDDILKELILRYTRGESTSVTVDESENLLSSFLYTIDMYLLSLHSAEAALYKVKTLSISELYNEGIKAVEECFVKARKLYYDVIKSRLKVELDPYNDTIDEAMPIFFDKYDIIFQAHNGMGSIDYPLMFDDMKVNGVLYIYNYLHNLKIENQFCSFFSIDDINSLIKSYGRICRINSSIELINIFELVAGNCIFTMICGNRPENIRLNLEDYNIVAEKFEALTEDNIKELIKNAAESIIKYFSIDTSSFKKYIIDFAVLLSGRVITSIKNGSLNSIVIIEDRTEPVISSFKSSCIMDKLSFDNLMKKISEEDTAIEKAKLILNEVHSLDDFIDILESDIFYGEEYKLLFKSMDETGLALVVKTAFYEMMREGERNMDKILCSSTYDTDSWKYQLADYIMNAESGEGIMNTALKLNFDDLNYGI